MSKQWIPTALRGPVNGQRVEWLCPNTGDVVAGSIWIMEGSGMYVYYAPAFWRARDTLTRGGE